MDRPAAMRRAITISVGKMHDPDAIMLREGGFQAGRRTLMLDAAGRASELDIARGISFSLSASKEDEVLNRFDHRSPMAGEAEVKYLDGDFRVIRPGAYVRCAVTGVPIPLEELKYWSVELQEPYSSPDAVLKRFHAGQGGTA
jgi:hypothetical protein